LKSTFKKVIDRTFDCITENYCSFEKNIIMKTKTMLPIIGCILCLVTTNNSFCQKTVNPKSPGNAYASITPNTSLIDLDTTAYANVSVEVNNKVQKSFAQYFKSATGQTWSIWGKNFHTNFYVNGVLTRALFSKSGQLIYTVTYGSEKDMPADIRKIVRSEYYDYSIILAAEVEQDKRDIWVITMENSNEQIIVRVEENDMEQVEKFKKSK